MVNKFDLIVIDLENAVVTFAALHGLSRVPATLTKGLS